MLQSTEATARSAETQRPKHSSQAPPEGAAHSPPGHTLAAVHADVGVWRSPLHAARAGSVLACVCRGSIEAWAMARQCRHLRSGRRCHPVHAIAVRCMQPRRRLCFGRALCRLPIRLPPLVYLQDTPAVMFDTTMRSPGMVFLHMGLAAGAPCHKAEHQWTPVVVKSCKCVR